MNKAQALMKILDEDFKKDLFKFLDHPWKEDAEIDFVALINEYRDRFKKSSESMIKTYLKKMDKANVTGSFMNRVSDGFMDAWSRLIK